MVSVCRTLGDYKHVQTVFFWIPAAVSISSLKTSLFLNVNPPSSCSPIFSAREMTAHMTQWTSNLNQPFLMFDFNCIALRTN